MLKTKGHYDLMSQFERDFPYLIKDKEPKMLWEYGNVYANGKTNELFKAYRIGYVFGKYEAQNNG